MIFVTQWLCSHRHCAIALIWNSDCTPKEVIETHGEDLFKRGLLARKCGICEGELTVEHKPTRFKTIQEAECAATPMMMEQAIVRATVERLKHSNRN